MRLVLWMMPFVWRIATSTIGLALGLTLCRVTVLRTIHSGVGVCLPRGHRIGVSGVLLVVAGVEGVIRLTLVRLMSIC